MLNVSSYFICPLFITPEVLLKSVRKIRKVFPKMLYHYLRFLNWIFTAFGLRKPFLSMTGKPSTLNIFHKLWPVIISIYIVACYTTCIDDAPLSDVTKVSGIILRTNDMILNVNILLFSMASKDIQKCQLLYKTVLGIIENLQITRSSLKLFVIKLLLWISVPSLLMVYFVILEFYVLKSYYTYFTLLFRIPMFLQSFHLLLHIYILLALLKALNSRLSRVLSYNYAAQNWIEPFRPQRYQTLKYFMNPSIFFLENKGNSITQADPKFLCAIYDELNTCVILLEQYHGFGMLMAVWLLFISAVVTTTDIVVQKVTNLPIVVAACVLPFIWFYIFCFIEDHMRKEVENTDTIIVKFLIDFRCVEPRRKILQTFKELVSTHRLRFTACNLLLLNFSTLMGTIVNVITYSIILIQLSLTEN